MDELKRGLILRKLGYKKKNKTTEHKIQLRSTAKKRNSKRKTMAKESDENLR